MQMKFLNQIVQADCLDYLKSIESESVDLILTDPPYNITQNKWDNEVDLTKLFIEFKRIKKQNSPILIFATGIFLHKVILANIKNYKYDLIWQKDNRVSGFLNANRQPLRNHESILVFYEKQPTYNPQFTTGQPLHSKGNLYLKKDNINNNYNCYKQGSDNRKGTTQKYPKSVLNFAKEHPSQHPTQKPIKLLEYLIKTYSNENDIVLDCFAGSGSTAVACKNTNRNFLSCELNEKYCTLANKRLSETLF